MPIEDPVIREAYNKMRREQVKERYKNDPEFRRKCYEATKKWREKNRKKYNRYHKFYQRKKKMEEKNANKNM